MDPANLRLILVADAPSALLEVCGVTLLDRLLRQAQRVGLREALILSATPEAIRGEIARPSWPRGNVAVEVEARAPGPITVEELSRNMGDARPAIVVRGDIYCDIRLLRALAAQTNESVVLDSAPGATVASSATQTQSPSFGPAHLTKTFLQTRLPNELLSDALEGAVAAGTIQAIDAALFPRYIPDIRRDVRPFCLGVSPDSRPEIEAIVLNSAQKGTLDLPAYVHGPIETFIISYLCRTNVSPNEMTIAAFLFGALGTVCFATGHFVIGLVIALIFGVLDGLDGKLARVKIETTPKGELEHALDLVLEYSWWIAIGWGLRRTGLLPSALFFAGLLVGGEILGQIARGHARRLTGHLLDDFTPFDRFFRRIAGRRNIYVWLLVIIGCWSGAANAYRTIAIWSAASGTVHLVRAVLIHLKNKPASAPVESA